jgi:predicted RNA binding protein YcfA (HicA-like mRNA interferase family)
MPKIPAVSSKKFCKILEQEGFKLARIEGDHYIYIKDTIARPLVVPIRKQLPIFIILNNLKTAGISRKDFIRLLKNI